MIAEVVETDKEEGGQGRSILMKARRKAEIAMSTQNRLMATEHMLIAK